MFTLYLLSFTVKLSSFGLAAKARIILHRSHLCTILSRKHKRESHVCHKRDTKSPLEMIHVTRKILITAEELLNSTVLEMHRMANK